MTAQLKRYLDDVATRYEKKSFIDNDPVCIPHAFESPTDQEIIGLFAAILAWGRRDTMISKMGDLCERMNYQPHKFVVGFSPVRDATQLAGFGHRTFLTDDAINLVVGIQSILKQYGTIARLCETHLKERDVHIGPAIEALSRSLLSQPYTMPVRMRKHLPLPSAGSACKRLCMYFRWMVRPGPVDLGIWTDFRTEQLILPLDVHSARQARTVGLLHRKTNDWKAALELTSACRKLDPLDPARYDFAFFGTGVRGEELLQPDNTSQGLLTLPEATLYRRDQSGV